jgi:hypothetical protein
MIHVSKVRVEPRFDDIHGTSMNMSGCLVYASTRTRYYAGEVSMMFFGRDGHYLGSTSQQLWTGESTQRALPSAPALGSKRGHHFAADMAWGYWLDPRHTSMQVLVKVLVKECESDNVDACNYHPVAQRSSLWAFNMESLAEGRAQVLNLPAVPEEGACGSAVLGEEDDVAVRDVRADLYSDGRLGIQGCLRLRGKRDVRYSARILSAEFRDIDDGHILAITGGQQQQVLQGHDIVVNGDPVTVLERGPNGKPRDGIYDFSVDVRPDDELIYKRMAHRAIVTFAVMSCTQAPDAAPMCEERTLLPRSVPVCLIDRRSSAGTQDYRHCHDLRSGSALTR